MKIGDYRQHDRDGNLTKLKIIEIFTSFLFISDQQVSQATFSPYNIENRPKQNQLLGALEPVPTLEGQFADVVKPQYANFISR